MGDKGRFHHKALTTLKQLIGMEVERRANRFDGRGEADYRDADQ